MAAFHRVAKKQFEESIKNVLDSLDAPPEMLTKLINEVGASQDKFRAAFNSVLSPRVKPTFFSDPEAAAVSPRDVDFLGDADPLPTRPPHRMFDVDRGNLVESPAIGPRGYYCMLSHRWRGAELALGNIREARRKAMERAKEAARGEPVGGQAHKRDVDLVLDQCRRDIEEQENLILELVNVGGREGEGQGEGEGADVKHLLRRLYEARAAEDGLESAKDSEVQAKSRLRFAKMEQRVFNDLVGNTQERDEEEEEEEEQQEEEESSDGSPRPPPPPSANQVGSRVVQEAAAELERAEVNLKRAKESYETAQGHVLYFQQHRHLRDALEEIVLRLQRWKSAMKFEGATREAARIFNTKPFPSREKRYLWIDTCCIDKTNSGELTESLSLMGDWPSSRCWPLLEEDDLRDWGPLCGVEDRRGGR
ncbi:hypothetical protein VTH06DRAFT_7591 [Thermothelomyces fergusii]